MTTANRKLMVPTIHLNGTSREQLIEGYLDALRALRAAEDAMGKITVHGRDYYVQNYDQYGEYVDGKPAIGRALDEHRARFDKIAAVISELEEVVDGIAKQ